MGKCGTGFWGRFARNNQIPGVWIFRGRWEMISGELRRVRRRCQGEGARFDKLRAVLGVIKDFREGLGATQKFRTLRTPSDGDGPQRPCTPIPLHRYPKPNPKDSPHFFLIAGWQHTIQELSEHCNTHNLPEQREQLIHYRRTKPSTQLSSPRTKDFLQPDVVGPHFAAGSDGVRLEEVFCTGTR